MREDEPFGPERVVVIDGGMSTALAAHGADLSGPLWTARAIVGEPEAVVAAHLDFLRAGARVLITASYQASLEGSRRAGIDADRGELLLRRSAELGRQARDRFADERPEVAETVLIAGSIGAYGAMLAGGQEFTGDYGDGVGRRELEAFHRPQIEILLDAGVDLLAVETLPRVDEAAAIVSLLAGIPEARAWIAFTGGVDARTAAGDDIAEGAAIADSSTAVVAVGVNCTPPGHVVPLLDRLRDRTDLPLVVYPNAGGIWEPGSRSWSASERDRFSPEEVRSWVGAGARLVGGCCGIGPQGIRGIADALG
jgi:homocysteine S-methyltransferase